MAWNRFTAVHAINSINKIFERPIAMRHFCLLGRLFHRFLFFSIIIFRTKYTYIYLVYVWCSFYRFERAIIFFFLVCQIHDTIIISKWPKMTNQNIAQTESNYIIRKSSDFMWFGECGTCMCSPRPPQTKLYHIVMRAKIKRAFHLYSEWYGSVRLKCFAVCFPLKLLSKWLVQNPWLWHTPYMCFVLSRCWCCCCYRHRRHVKYPAIAQN